MSYKVKQKTGINTFKELGNLVSDEEKSKIVENELNITKLQNEKANNTELHDLRYFLHNYYDWEKLRHYITGKSNSGDDSLGFDILNLGGSVVLDKAVNVVIDHYNSIPVQRELIPGRDYTITSNKGRLGTGTYEKITFDNNTGAIIITVDAPSGYSIDKIVYIDRAEKYYGPIEYNGVSYDKYSAFVCRNYNDNDVVPTASDSPIEIYTIRQLLGTSGGLLADYVKTEDLATVATTGSYNDLDDLPEIPEGSVVYQTFGQFTDGAISQKVVTDKVNEIDASLENINESLEDKVSKDGNKVLSTNDFTTAYMNKLDGIAANAEVNVQADWNETNTSSDAYIKNKPTIPNAITIDTATSTTSTNPLQNKIITNELNAILDNTKLIQSGGYGFIAGRNATGDGAGASIGYEAQAIGGGASVGSNTYSKGGGAVGMYARTEMGGAVGYDAQSTNGFAGGQNAKATAYNAVQLGSGTNNTANTLKYLGYTLADSSGNLYEGNSKLNTIYETITNVDSKDTITLNSAKTYTDEKVAALINGAPETLDTLDELAAALKDNADIVDTLNNAISNKLSLTGGTMNASSTITFGGTSNATSAKLKWSTVNSNTPYIGYASDQTDGTFVISSLKGTNYASGLAIGGGSGNLLWKGTKVATTADIPTVNNATLTIQKNGTSIGTFTSNASTNSTINITVPTGAAADKGVVTTVDTSANLPTSNAVKTFVEGKGYVTSSGSVASATKATQDGNGNVISSTYATKDEASFNMPIGSIFASATPQTSKAFHLLDGSVLDSSVDADYQTFVNYINTVAGQYNIAVSEDEYNTILSTYGQCGKFVVTSTSVRLPTITKFIQGLSDLTNLNDIGTAELDTIKSHTHDYISYKYTGTNANWGLKASGNSGDTNTRETQTSTSTGDDETKPKNVKYPYYIVVSTKEEIVWSSTVSSYWSMSATSTEMYFKHNGTAIMTLTSSGAVLVPDVEL